MLPIAKLHVPSPSVGGVKTSVTLLGQDIGNTLRRHARNCRPWGFHPIPLPSVMLDLNSLIVPMPLPLILLVEDDDNDVLLMRRALVAAQVQNPLLVAHDGEHAIELLRKTSNKPGLLITDIKMPKIDGFELLLWLQTHPYFKDTPKLVISSSVLEDDLAKSLPLGATAYFIKPTDHHDLVELVRQWKKTYLEGVPRT